MILIVWHGPRICRGRSRVDRLSIVGSRWGRLAVRVRLLGRPVRLLLLLLVLGCLGLALRIGCLPLLLGLR